MHPSLPRAKTIRQTEHRSWLPTTTPTPTPPATSRVHALADGQLSAGTLDYVNYLAVDLAGPAVQSVDAAADFAITTANRAAGRQVILRLVADGPISLA